METAYVFSSLPRSNAEAVVIAEATHALANLPDIESARLPVAYENAKHALAECTRIDECMDWANKAEALASYAKQAQDDALRRMADRIQARAIRRCSELLKQIPKAKNQYDAARRADEGTLTRTQAAERAGMSEWQQVTAMRVGALSLDEFERQVESDCPPTVTQLAEQGKKSRALVDLDGINPAVFRKATEAGALIQALANFGRANDPLLIAGGFKGHECAAIRSHIAVIDSWIDRFVTNLQD